MMSGRGQCRQQTTVKRAFRQPVWVVSSSAVDKLLTESTCKYSGHLLKITHGNPIQRSLSSVRVCKVVFQTLLLFVFCTMLFYSSILSNDVNVHVDWTTRRLVQVANVRVYLYSAIGVRYEAGEDNPELNNAKPDTYYNHVTMVGWEHNAIMNSNYTCCYLLQNNTIISVTSNPGTLRYGNSGNYSVLKATRYECPLSFDHRELNAVSLAFGKDMCGSDVTNYITPTFPVPRNRTGIALCTKVAYGDLNPHMLVEWFEVQRALGVTKVLAFLYLANLNAESVRILQHYEAIGFAELVPHDIPEKDLIPRDVGGTSLQSYNDDRVTLLDCHERLHGYRFVAVLDKDEIILPTKFHGEKALEKFLESIWRLRSNIAGVRFFTQIHPLPNDVDSISLNNDVIESFDDQSTNRQTFLGTFPQCSAPMKDRVKFVYMPTRVQQGAIHTHSYENLPNFIKVTVRPSEAVVHHYRHTRSDWTDDNLAKVRPENLYNCSDMQHFLAGLDTADLTALKHTFDFDFDFVIDINTVT